MLSVVLFSLPQTVLAGVEWENLQKFSLEEQALDVTTSFDGKTAFMLTPGAILVYSIKEKKINARIPVDPGFNRISYTEGDRLVLSASKPSSVSIIQYSTVYNIDISERPVKGPANAKVTIVVFDDYQCPYCARLEQFTQQLLERNPEQVKYIIKQYPIPGHSFAFKASMAALAAAEQGKFWEFHKKLFENYNALNDEKIQSIAKDLSLDMTKFNNDLNSKANRKLILNDIEEGKKIGVSGTPSLFLNGKKVDNRNLSKLPQLIQKEAEASK
jgi:protein-disulfide isomerase